MTNTFCSLGNDGQHKAQDLFLSLNSPKASYMGIPPSGIQGMKLGLSQYIHLTTLLRH